MIFIQEVRGFVHPVQCADQRVDRSQDDVGLRTDAPVFIAVLVGDADVRRGHGVRVRADGVLRVGDELVVAEVVFCLPQCVADRVQTTVSE